MIIKCLKLTVYSKHILEPYSTWPKWKEVMIALQLKQLDFAMLHLNLHHYIAIHK
jgi:hypothetical protein